MPTNRYYDYFKTLRTNYTPITRVEWLADDDTVLFDITGDTIQDGTLNVQYQNGMRRSANIVLDNWLNIYDINVNKIWFGQKLRLSQGLILNDGTEFYIPQGIFYISNPTIVFNPSERKTNLQLVDKWGYLDGSLFGKLEGIYQLAIDNNLFTAIQQLLIKDRGNGVKIDSSPPILSSYYIGKTVTVNGVSHPTLNCPYTYRSDIGASIADLLLEINTMLVSSIGYDAVGRLNVLPAQTDILDSTREVLWDFTTDECEFLGMSATAKMTEVYNDVIITGATLNGSIVKGRAQNTNIKSDICIQRIGSKIYIKSESKYYSNEQCQALADYTLLRSQILKKSVDFQCAPMYHFKENGVVTIRRVEFNEEPQPYLLNSYSIPIGQTGVMTCSVTSINDLL